MDFSISQLQYYNDKGKPISPKTNGKFPLAEFITALNGNTLITCVGMYEGREFMILRSDEKKFFACADVRGSFIKRTKKTALISFQDIVVDHELLKQRDQIEHSMVSSGLKVFDDLYLSVNEENQEVHLAQSV